MKLEKAIKILTIHNDHNPDFTDADRRNAHNLGIEALKQVCANRHSAWPNRADMLPGETKE